MDNRMNAALRILSNSLSLHRSTESKQNSPVGILLGARDYVTIKTPRGSAGHVRCSISPLITSRKRSGGAGLLCVTRDRGPIETISLEVFPQPVCVVR